jgi:uncharacterized protein YacL
MVLASMYISVIVLASAAAYHSSEDCRASDSSTCKRNKYAISLGCIGAVIALVISFMANSGKLEIYLETASAFLCLLSTLPVLL